MSRQNISSGMAGEERIGYSRAVKVGNIVHVSGSTAPEALDGDPYGQTEAILQKAERALKEAGAGMQDVVRVRVYVTNVDDWPEVARAYSTFFLDVRPTLTMVEVSRLVSPEHQVEIEMEAIIAGDG